MEGMLISLKTLERTVSGHFDPYPEMLRMSVETETGSWEVGSSDKK